MFQISFTAVFTYMLYWLYVNQTLENANNKWVKRLTEGSGGKSVMKALEVHKELEAFKRVS
jgi:hypothetical protein